MNIWSSEAVQLFLLLFVPGFISIKIFDLLVASERRDYTKSIPEVVSYSVLNFAFFFPIYLLLPVGFKIDHPIWYTVFIYLVLLIAPIVWPFAWRNFSKTKFYGNNFCNLTPTAWDYIFNKREAFWVIAHLADGRRIGGRYDTQSFATTYPGDPQIYIEEVWKLGENGEFIAKVAASKGIVILTKDLSSIEFFL